MSDKQKKRRSLLSVALFLVAVAVFLVGLVFVIRQLAFQKPMSQSCRSTARIMR